MLNKSDCDIIEDEVIEPKLIDTIMIFAAGKGTRMKNLTTHTPKPFLDINGRPFITYTIDLAIAHNFKKIIINTHYLAAKFITLLEKLITEYYADKNILNKITIVYEPVLLDTGGTIKNAYQLRLLSKKPIFTINSDTIVTSSVDIFTVMERYWDANKMDFLLLLKEYNQVIGYKGVGDFELLSDNQLSRNRLHEAHYSYMYCGIQILKPLTINLNQRTIFSLSEYYQECNKLYGITIPELNCYHANTQEDIQLIQSIL